MERSEARSRAHTASEVGAAALATVRLPRERRAFHVPPPVWTGTGGGAGRLRRRTNGRDVRAAAAEHRALRRRHRSRGPPRRLRLRETDLAAARRIASDAVLFENAYAQSSWTRPAVASLFTGLLPPAHRTVGRRSVLPEDAVTLAEILAANGYEGMGLVRNPNVGRAFASPRASPASAARTASATRRCSTGCGCGWMSARGTSSLSSSFCTRSTPMDPTTRRPSSSRCSRPGGAPEHYRTVRYLLGLNSGEVEPEPETVDLLSRLYDAEVAQNDRAFGELLDELSSAAWSRTRR